MRSSRTRLRRGMGWRPETRRGVVVRLGLMGAVASALIAMLGSASAAVPVFPNNILVFPNRDFVTVEGYQDHAGEVATIQVRRGGVLIGSAQGTVSGGDVAFEVNHPGGVCWGAGTNLQVTPDIQAGDAVSISFNGTVLDDTTVQDAGFPDAVSDTSVNGATVVIRGHLGTINRPDPANIEQRVVNPDLVPLIGKRDVRAIPGPLVPAAKGGYSSSLEISGDILTATYVFDDPAVADVVANGGGERILSWQLTDAAGNRQGVTIAEAGELGGPGMGGCPAGPTQVPAPQPGTASAIRSNDKTSVQVSWTPATAVPTAQPVTGYSVVAIAATAASSGDQVQVGKRTLATATRSTIGGLDPAEAYNIEVRSLAGPRMSDAFTVALPTPTPTPPDTVVLPTVSATPAPATGTGAVQADSLTLTGSPGTDIFFTTDGSPAVSGDLPSDTAVLYTGPISITAPTTLNWAAFDTAGNFAIGEGRYTPVAGTVVPATPTLRPSSAGQGTLTANWDATDPSITGYVVQLYAFPANTPVGGPRATTAKTLTVTGLAPGQYTFTVVATNGQGSSPESAHSPALTVAPVTDQVSITKATWKAGDFRVTGTGSVVGAIITIRSGSATGPVLGTAQVVAGNTYDMRQRNGAAPSTRPATVFAVSDGGGKAGPAAVG